MSIIHAAQAYPFFQFLGMALVALAISIVISIRSHNWRPFWLVLAVWVIGGLVGTVLVELHMHGILHY